MCRNNGMSIGERFPHRCIEDRELMQIYSQPRMECWVKESSSQLTP